MLLKLPVMAVDDETPSDRRDRLHLVASAIATASTSEEGLGSTMNNAAALVAVGYKESGFSQKVGAGRCNELPSGACDGGKAVGYWQTWESGARGEGVAGWSVRAIRHLRMGAGYCRVLGSKYSTMVFSSVSLYATGKRCSWSGAKERAQLASQVKAHLLAEWKKKAKSH